MRRGSPELPRDCQRSPPRLLGATMGQAVMSDAPRQPDPGNVVSRRLPEGGENHANQTATALWGRRLNLNARQLMRTLRRNRSVACNTTSTPVLAAIPATACPAPRRASAGQQSAGWPVRTLILLAKLGVARQQPPEESRYQTGIGFHGFPSLFRSILPRPAAPHPEFLMAIPQS